jgi:tetrahedral aminopeptidase
MPLNIELLKRLCETHGVPGREARVRELIEQEITGLFDEVRQDAMGSLLCVRRSRTGAQKPTRVMLLAHMDEIGFLVSHIDEKGFLRVNPVGGFDPRNLFSRRVTVCAKEGDLHGVMNPGGRPVHIASEEDKKKVPEIKEFFVDTGMDAEEVKAKVRVGDMVVWDEPFRTMGHKVVSKAMDNRYACWVAIEAVRALADVEHACELHVAFTVQEEVGLRGAMTTAFDVNPDIAIGLDVSLACDTPGVPSEEAVNRHGEGFGLHVMDGSFIADEALIDELEKVAHANNIACQRSILARGGQDGAAGQRARSGARAAGVVVGTRYIHTVTEMVDVRDLEAALDVLVAWVPTVG